MKTIAVHTLGCKVNQYDSQAMLELFERAGYLSVAADREADVYLVNTCTVTGTGDQKSLKLIRRLHREHPEAKLIVAGCLSQRDARSVLLPGVALVIGNRARARVVELFERALAEGAPIDAVASLRDAPFEPLRVARSEGRTRAVLKIQEGCDRYCAYCVIPSVRGPVRSMPLDEVEREARILAGEGYLELVLTGIHLASYGRGTADTLADAVERAHGVPGIARIRLGSLEPLIADEAFCRRLSALNKLCPQFHLSLQSGSDDVLRAMKRRYTTAEYLRAVELLRAHFPGCAVTTDVLCGFPGETDAQAEETERFALRVGFARMHVFPYSRREGTAAAAMPGHLSARIKKNRALRLIEIGNQMEAQYAKGLLGRVEPVLFEEASFAGAQGYTRQYVRVRAQGGEVGRLMNARLEALDGQVLVGRVCEQAP